MFFSFESVSQFPQDFFKDKYGSFLNTDLNVLCNIQKALEYGYLTYPRLKSWGNSSLQSLAVFNTKDSAKIMLIFIRNYSISSSLLSPSELKLSRKIYFWPKVTSGTLHYITL